MLNKFGTSNMLSGYTCTCISNDKIKINLIAEDIEQLEELHDHKGRKHVAKIINDNVHLCLVEFIP